MRDKPTVSGSLTLVSTPIGNLGDMTLRGIETLKNADAIFAEDTRHTRKLLTHYEIKNRLESYHDFNKERVTPGIVERMKQGEHLALVSDAGTPGISDPGFYLVRAALREGIRVTAAPGANAVLPALAISGFPTDAFVFEGFLPRKPGELRRKLESFAEERRTAVFFVSPHRLLKVLRAVQETLPGRRCAVARELTKIHEEVSVGSAREMLELYEGRAVKGEIVLLVEGADKYTAVTKGVTDE
ncbi:MAG: 16S rRNA (cytidine(1402)-2'-O)-methyltransferase [Chitinivibrionia bacterium]|nr:16S rRNA (cytidine(1402)-2'-O)-methyltransferase [Chitinivibrionia bacterium]